MAIREDQILGFEPVERGIGTVPAPIGFGQTLADNINYYVQPIANDAMMRGRFGLGTQLDPNFTWSENIPERHRQYTTSYAYAMNAEQQAEITNYLDSRTALKDRMSRAPIGYQIIGEFLNPINYLGITFGAPIMSAGRIAVGRTALRASASAAAVEAGLNVGLEALDPTQTLVESAANVASVAAFSAAFDLGASIPRIRRQAAQQELRAQTARLFNIARRAEEIGPVQMPSAGDGVDIRPLREDEDVERINQNYLQTLNGLRDEQLRVPEGSAEHELLQQRIRRVEDNRRPYAQELMFRALESEGIDVNDMYRPAQGADNWFMNLVTTPVRRVLTADYGRANNTAKRAIAQIAFDGGLQLEMHRAGVTDGLSIAQESARDLGIFAVAHDEMMQLWARDTGAPEVGSSVFAGRDINITNLTRRASSRSDTIDNWLNEVSRKRLLGESMTDAQAQAAEIMDRYFEFWEGRTVETGQLRTPQSLNLQIKKLSEEIDVLRVSLSGRGEAAKRGLLEQKEQLLQELTFERDNPLQGNREPHLPRYFLKDVIRARRDEFAEILRGWFRENPYIMRYSPERERWEKVALGTDEQSINARVEQTIKNILGENQNKDVEEIFIGSNRAGNLRGRSLDIPNRLVVDFIELNPTALMGSYARRVSPQYHFQKRFGTNKKRLLQSIRAEMMDAGVSEKQIARYVRDFDTVYRRVVGRVIDEPDALNQRVATFLRDMTGFSFLGSAGVAAIGDMGRIVMENEMPTLARSLQASFDPVIRALNTKEVRASGGALDILLGSAHQRMMDDQNYNVVSNTAMDKARNVFFNANLLGPVTVFGKLFSGMNGGHMLIEYSQRLARGEASEFEAAYLARHGIDLANAKRIANAPWQTDPKSGLILPNTDAWITQPRFVNERNQTVPVIDASEGEIGRTFNGVYQPVFLDKNGALHIDREYIESTFEDAPWVEPLSPEAVSGAERFRDEFDFNEKPWTSAPFNLAEDAITSENQWLNFLAARESALKASETFQNRQGSLFAMSNEEIVDAIGNDFLIDKLVTDTAIVQDVFDRLGFPNDFARHVYGSFDPNDRGGHLGTVYLHKANIARLWLEIENDLVDPKAALGRINDQLINDEIHPTYYQHLRALYENADLFQEPNDLFEFILIHELHHGPNREIISDVESGEFRFFDQITDPAKKQDLLDNIPDMGLDPDQERIAYLVGELGFDWSALPEKVRADIVSDMEVEVGDFSEAAGMIVRRARVYYERMVKRVEESEPEYEARIDDLALAYLRERRQQQEAQNQVANSIALRASGGASMDRNAFSSPEQYANFLGMRALADADPRNSFQSLGLNEADVAIREAFLNTLALRQVESAERANRDLVDLFRGALSTHVNNVIMTASAMDRPTIMDGVMYIPNRFGEMFGLKPDPNVPGYSRVENGFLALPLQFYGFAMANVNKTVGVMMQGAVRNRLGGVVAMMAMGYMISSIRTPDYVWDDMSPQDKLARSFDMSGVAALYSDLFYTTLQTSLALDGPNITGGVLQPRYPQDPNMVDAVTNVTGAASGWTADMVRSAATFASGDYGEGASQFIRNLPFSNLWFLREDVNQLGRYLAN